MPACGGCGGSAAPRAPRRRRRRTRPSCRPPRRRAATRRDAVLRVERVLLVGRTVAYSRVALVRLAGVRASPSTSSNRTAVMLSSPPPRFAALDERLRRRVEVAAVRRDELLDRLAVDHVGEPVGAEQEDVAGLAPDRERVDVDVGVGAERARDHRALRVHLGLLRRELAAAHELGDERVVVGELLELRRRGAGRRASRRRGRS